MKKTDIFDITARVCEKAVRGDFDKLRYKKVYEKVLEHTDSENTGAKCLGPVKTQEGWSCVVSHGGKNTVLYITDDGNNLSFWEKEI